MDHSFHLLSSVQCNLLRHLQVIYSTVIAQNNVVGSEIWIINISSPQAPQSPRLLTIISAPQTMVPTALWIWGISSQTILESAWHTESSSVENDNTTPQGRHSPPWLQSQHLSAVLGWKTGMKWQWHSQAKNELWVPKIPEAHCVNH